MFGLNVSVFESSVNSEGIETLRRLEKWKTKFESSVNSEGIETLRLDRFVGTLFESSVNSEGIETLNFHYISSLCLRAV